MHRRSVFSLPRAAYNAARAHSEPCGIRAVKAFRDWLIAEAREARTDSEGGMIDERMSTGSKSWFHQFSGPNIGS